MVISGILALVAIGVGIWAFTTSSSLNDSDSDLEAANATIAKQKKQLASQEQTAQTEEAPGGLR